jgi:cystathionine gamma-synthase
MPLTPGLDPIPSDPIPHQHHLATQLIHRGKIVDPSTGAITPAIYPSTTFERSVDGQYPQGYLYSRLDNPNRHALEQCLAQIEGGQTAIAFSSGSAATLSLLQALRPGDHVIAPQEAYHGTTQLLRQLFIPWGLAVSFVEMSDLAQVAAAITPQTRLIWIETPSNPMLRLTDIRAVADLAHQTHLPHQGKALCVCDSTWAPPVVQRPLDLGADWVVHATTKYLGGHGDLLGGAAIARSQDHPFYQRVRQLQGMGGAVPSAFDCWLLLRGIRTLGCRLGSQCDNALKIAEFLAQHPRVSAVHYPGLAQHPQHALARQQMQQFGGMLSVQIAGGEPEAMAVAAKVKLFTRATSLGGVESLIEHRASIEPPDTLTPRNLLRLSLGLEDVRDLVADLAQALDIEVTSPTAKTDGEENQEL